MRPRPAFAAVALLVSASVAGAAEPARRDPAAVAAEIDKHIDARLATEKVPAPPAADDAEFLRRACLDVAGRVPTPERAAAFLDSRAADKRAKLIDELLDSPDYARNFANVWHDLIVPRTPINNRIDPEALRAAFAAEFAANTPWSEVVAKLLLTRGGTLERNFLAFYRVNGDMGGIPMPNVAARSYTRLFLGLRMECSECHDDPQKPGTQAGYWGFAAFFGRVALDQKQNVQPVGVVEGAGYKTPKGSNFRLTPRADVSLTVHSEAWTKAGTPLPPRFPGGPPLAFPAGKPMLAELAAWTAGPDNPYLARAAVNRWWAHFFARGLVNPVDDFRDGNDPTHPEVLELLTREFTASGHDLKHLIRCVCATKAYQRTSRALPGNAKLDDPLYARAAMKVLTAEQLLDSLSVAYGDAELFPVNPPPRRGQPAPFTRRHFLTLFGTNDPLDGDPTDYLHGVPQVLHLMNAPAHNAGGKRVDALLKGGAKPEAVVETLYLATLSRRPTAAELKRKLELVRSHPTERDGLVGVLWTLVNGAEFLLNH